MFRYENSEQLEIRAAVRRMAEHEIPKYRKLSDKDTVPRQLFAALADLGLTGIVIKDQFGGLGQGALTSSIVMEELARVDLGPAIFISVHNMVASLIQRCGNDQQRKAYLPRLSSGELLGAFALTEPQAGSDAQALRTTAVKQDQNYILNGQKCYITSAGSADIYIIFARTDQTADKNNISAFIVEKSAAGISFAKPEKKMAGELSPIASILLENVAVNTAALLGAEHEGYKVALSGLAAGRINIAACANGLADKALELAIRHLKEREQFASKLIEFQGLQFMLADMAMKLEAAKLLTWQAAHTLENSPDSIENRLFPSYAKCFASDAAMSITTDAVQLLGGAGYISDYEVERLMREAKMLQIVEGTNQIQRLVIGRELAKRYS